METYHSQPNPVVTIVGKTKLRKDKEVTIRMNSLDLLELQKVMDKLNFGERATTVMYLIYHYNDIEKAALIVNRYTQLRKISKEFDSLF
jgi:hypothetical protein